MSSIKIKTQQQQQKAVVVDQFTISTSNQELEIEVDCAEDGDFGSLYRVWKGMRLIGTYHECCDADGWKCLPIDTSTFVPCNSEEEAQEKIISSYLDSRLV